MNNKGIKDLKEISYISSMKKELEKQLREEYNNYQSKAHPEDRMSFIDYVQGLGLFKGYKIKIRTTFDLDYKISFVKE